MEGVERSRHQGVADQLVGRNVHVPYPALEALEHRFLGGGGKANGEGMDKGEGKGERKREDNGKYQGCSRVVARPTGRVRRL